MVGAWKASFPVGPEPVLDCFLVRGYVQQGTAWVERITVRRRA
ncbi:hypothetical protein [uncultured Paludibaculum sp.]|nr:hypothetical protein [uncultured Paludibaculum sp.]